MEICLIYDISCKTLIGSTALRIVFDELDGFIRDYNRTRYLALFNRKKYDVIFTLINFYTGKLS